jgi:hypothetical protein
MENRVQKLEEKIEMLQTILNMMLINKLPITQPAEQKKVRSTERKNDDVEFPTVTEPVMADVEHIRPSSEKSVHNVSRRIII